MAKGQQKSNREAKKPKQTKKPAGATAASMLQTGASAPVKPAKK
jgi:hypothetical protein